MNKEFFENMREQMQPDAKTVNDLRRKIAADNAQKNTFTALKFLPLAAAACIVTAVTIAVAPILTNNSDNVIRSPENSYTLSDDEAETENIYDSNTEAVSETAASEENEYYTYEEYLIYAEEQKRKYQELVGQMIYQVPVEDILNDDILQAMQPYMDSGISFDVKWTQELIDGICASIDEMAEGVKNGTLMIKKIQGTEYYTYEEYMEYSEKQKQMYQELFGQVFFQIPIAGMLNDTNDVYKSGYFMQSQAFNDNGEVIAVEWTQELIDEVCAAFDEAAESIKSGNLMISKSPDTIMYAYDGLMNFGNYEIYGLEMRSDEEVELGYFDSEKSYAVYNGKRVKYFIDYGSNGDSKNRCIFFDAKGEISLWVERDENQNIIGIREMSEEEYLKRISIFNMS